MFCFLVSLFLYLSFLFRCFTMCWLLLVANFLVMVITTSTTATIPILMTMTMITIVSITVYIIVIDVVIYICCILTTNDIHFKPGERQPSN